MSDADHDTEMLARAAMMRKSRASYQQVGIRPEFCRMEHTVQRNGRGRFEPGTVANPGGRPKKTSNERAADVLARQKAPAAMRKLIDMIESPNTSESGRLRAIELVLDRALGKASARSDSAAEGATFVIQQIVAVPPVGGFPGVLCHPDQRWVAKPTAVALSSVEAINAAEPGAS